MVRRHTGYIAFIVSLLLLGAWVASSTQPTVDLPDGDFNDLDADGTVTFDNASLISCDTDIEKLETDGTGVIVCGSVPAGITDHGALTGLADDDHSAYENELNNSAGLLAALSDETGSGLSMFGTAPVCSNVTVTDGALTSTQANSATSFTLNNATARTTGKMLAVQDNGTSKVYVDADGTTHIDQTTSKSTIAKGELRLRTNRESPGGNGTSGGFTKELRIGFLSQSTSDGNAKSYYEYMTEATMPYAAKFGVQETIYYEIDPLSDANVFKKKFNADVGGIFGGNTGMAGGGFFYNVNIADRTATGTTQAGAYAIIHQIVDFNVVVAASADGARLPVVATAPLGSIITVINSDATGSDTLKLYPATGGTVGAAVNTPITVPVDSIAHCFHWASNKWVCQVAAYDVS